MRPRGSPTVSSLHNRLSLHSHRALAASAGLHQHDDTIVASDNSDNDSDAAVLTRYGGTAVQDRRRGHSRVDHSDKDSRRKHKGKAVTTAGLSPEFAVVAARYRVLNTRSMHLTLVLTSWFVVYWAAYIVFAGVGLGYPLLYCFHLFDVVSMFVDLREVVRAIEFTWRKLLLTALLVVFVIYTYSVIAFVYFRQYYITVNYNEFACNTLASCFYFTLNGGLLQGGGIGDVAHVPELEVPNVSYVRMLIYNVSFFAVVNTVLVSGLVFSLINNKFSELRENLTKVQADTKNVCTLCSITRDRFEAGSSLSSFENHIDLKHKVQGGPWVCTSPTRRAPGVEVVRVSGSSLSHSGSARCLR